MEDGSLRTIAERAWPTQVGVMAIHRQFVFPDSPEPTRLMTALEITAIGRDLLLTVLVLSLPAVVVSLLVGGTISILQTVTSIQEQTLSFAPRIVAVALVLMVSLPWSLQVIIAFTSRMMHYMLEAAR